MGFHLYLGISTGVLVATLESRPSVGAMQSQLILALLNPLLE